ncbi:MAG: molecular chaperone DnaJ [Pseudomonadota bacterium]|nr:molecular chaperone DnaJ [Pseudomonadota bacterium]MDP1903960.1 molecular chaperone DnaJ [Pseudomonadota bacterium]MDP2351600.1 molecular chaperone DnaJ [Pseudomonadota bacterium]
MLPEEQELARLENEQAQLEEAVTSAELQLETTKVELAQFQYHYYQTVGRLYAELDDIEARIAGKLADASPEDKYAHEQAEAAQEKARKSAEEAGLAEKMPPPPPEITPELKLLYRKAAMLMHPDRATTDRERLRRNEMMTRVNIAYQSGDQLAIEKLVIEFGQDPEAITGEDVGARMIKAIRRIAQLRRRLAEIQPELEAQQQTEVFELMRTVNEAEAMGGDPFGDLARELMRQISERKIAFEMGRLDSIGVA